ncbi:unnamed protein product [Hydatigera taeniaeformis]|uniref:RING-type E3 ubiquitin transferase n=1 Tax=Hydatigena taeniaeformis TaxID=6205 RepID=A0A0R3X227_HYDTA|nr:unnamed protein product [Hydatigera taeniaeformis]
MDVTCPICLNIYFKPVKLPCGHILCQECLEKSLDISTLECPLCRHRLSVWKRRLKDISSCIDKARDTEIERLFPRYYSNRTEGLDVSLCDCEANVLREVTDSGQMALRVASPGAIKAEFDEAISRITRDNALEEGFREEASLALSRHMLLETNVENGSLAPCLQARASLLRFINSLGLIDASSLPSASKFLNSAKIDADKNLICEGAQQDSTVHQTSKLSKNRKVRSVLSGRLNLRSGRVLRDRCSQISFSKKI